MQTWVKWSCSAPEVAVLRRRVRANRSRSLAVVKRRTLRTFARDRGLREVRGVTLRVPNGGCHVELTEIEVAKRRYWTFRFEAFGGARPGRLAGLLGATAEHLLDDRDRPLTFRTAQSPRDSFAVARSLSYPEWLMAIAGRARRSKAFSAKA